MNRNALNCGGICRSMLSMSDENLQGKQDPDVDNMLCRYLVTREPERVVSKKARVARLVAVKSSAWIRLLAVAATTK